MDFTLWKGAKEGEPAWESPWGPGRPGWHIECSAMALHYLGEQVDLHGGGMDLIFPHHENEIAQSEAATGAVPFVRHWVHNAMMQLGDEKMAKSLGNIITIRAALDTYGPDGIRLFVLNGHYRIPTALLRGEPAGGQRGAERLRLALTLPLVEPGDDAGDSANDSDDARQRFIAAMDDDLGTPQALAVLFDLAHAINRARDAGRGAGAAVATLRELGGVLGLRFEAPAASLGGAPFIDLLVEGPHGPPRRPAVRVGRPHPHAAWQSWASPWRTDAMARHGAARRAAGARAGAPAAGRAPRGGPLDPRQPPLLKPGAAIA